MEALQVRRVQRSDELMQPADYVFIAKREPNITVERTPLLPPDGFLRRLIWEWFGKKYEVKQIVELVWPEQDTVIVNCPVCNNPCATTKHHKILSIEPLTLETNLTCPYCRTRTFTITEGNIMPA